MSDELKMAARVHYSFLPEHYEDDWLESQTTLLGFEHPLVVNFPLQAHSISSGDRILLYTDGLTETRNSHGGEFGYAGVECYVDAHSGEDNRDFVNGLSMAVCDYSKADIKDDILCLSIQVK